MKNKAAIITHNFFIGNMQFVALHFLGREDQNDFTLLRIESTVTVQDTTNIATARVVDVQPLIYLVPYLHFKTSFPLPCDDDYRKARQHDNYP